MLFEPWHAERLALWKRQIEAGHATKEGLKGEIIHHFALHSQHDPDQILDLWNRISVQPDPAGGWQAQVLSPVSALSP